MPEDKLCTRWYKSNFMTPLYWWITWTAFTLHFSHVDIPSELTPTSAKLSSSERGRYQQSHFTSLCCTEECLFHHPHSNGSYSPISLTPTCLSLVSQVPKSYRHSPHVISEEHQLECSPDDIEPVSALRNVCLPLLHVAANHVSPLDSLHAEDVLGYIGICPACSVLCCQLHCCFSHSLGHLDPELQSTDGQQQHTLDPILSAFARQELIRISPIFAGIFSKHWFVHSRPSLPWWFCYIPGPVFHLLQIGELCYQAISLLAASCSSIRGMVYLTQTQRRPLCTI